MESAFNSNSSQHQLSEKYERTLNFAIMSQSDEESNPKKKTSRDPMSHRIIEKRRRDRMNNCLADLSRLIPSIYMKKGRGRIEKTEIIEMAIKHLRHLQSIAYQPQAQRNGSNNIDMGSNMASEDSSRGKPGFNFSNVFDQHYVLGYQECASECMRFLVEMEGLYAGDVLCVRLMKHLQTHCDQLTKRRTEHMESLNMYNQEDSMMSNESKPLPPPLVNGFTTGLNLSDLQTKSAANSRSFSPTEGSTCTEESHMEDMRPRAYSLDCRLLAYGREHEINREEQIRRKNMALVNNGNQLREILQHGADPYTEANRHRSYSVNSRPVSAASTASSGSRAEEIYKFKTDIKDRFTADLHNLKLRPDSDIVQKRKISTSNLSLSKSHVLENTPEEDLIIDVENDDRPLGFAPESIRAPKPIKQEPRMEMETDDCSDANNVPVFALHPSSKFYIPMTLSSAIVWPNYKQLEVEKLAEAVLHQVSIAVNFKYPSSAFTAVNGFKPIDSDMSQPPFSCSNSNPVWIPILNSGGTAGSHCLPKAYKDIAWMAKGIQA